MPFQNPMRPYTRADVQSLNPNQNGVYGIFKGTSTIYIGSSGDLRERLLAHLNGDNACITRNTPDQRTGTIVSGDPTTLEGQLIREYSPVCTQRIPSAPPIRP